MEYLKDAIIYYLEGSNEDDEEYDRCDCGSLDCDVCHDEYCLCNLCAVCEVCDDYVGRCYYSGEHPWCSECQEYVHNCAYAGEHPEEFEEE